MERDAIINLVATKLNEITPYTDRSELPGYSYIETLLDQSTDTVFRILPYHRLPLLDLSAANLTAGTMTGEWFLTMPVNYIKFAEAQLSTWKRPVKELASRAEELLQGSEFTMGKPTRPVVVERKGASQITLHFFSSPVKTGVHKIFIVTNKKPETCPESIIDAITWQCAADVLLTIGKGDIAKAAQEKVLIV